MVHLKASYMVHLTVGSCSCDPHNSYFRLVFSPIFNIDELRLPACIALHFQLSTTKSRSHAFVAARGHPLSHRRDWWYAHRVLRVANVQAAARCGTAQASTVGHSGGAVQVDARVPVESGSASNAQLPCKLPGLRTMRRDAALYGDGGSSGDASAVAAQRTCLLLHCLPAARASLRRLQAARHSV